MDNSEFFNKVSQFYDEMINFDKALERRISFFEKFNLSGNALDFGCGSGLDSISLSKLGLKVIACDQSDEMIRKAKHNANKYYAKIDFMNISFQDLHKFQPKKFDLIVSMGNTLANLDTSGLKLFLNSLPEIMNENSKIIFQLVNFAAISFDNEYLLNALENDAILIKRYYSKSEDKILFNIDFVEKKANIRKTLSTEIFPHSKEFFTEQFEKHELAAKFFGGIDLSEFIPDLSKDLIIVV